MDLRTITVIAAGGLLVGCNGPLEVSGVAADADMFQRFPAVMRDFPVWQPANTPLYDFEMRDGARKPSGGLRYTSKLAAPEIAARFKSHAATIDCTVTSADETRSLAECGGSPARGLELHFNAAGAEGQDVVVLFLGTTPEFEEVSF